MATNKRVERQLADMCWRNTRQKKRCTLPAAKTGAAHKTRRAARLQFVVRNAEFMGKNARQRNASPAFLQPGLQQRSFPSLLQSRAGSRVTLYWGRA